MSTGQKIWRGFLTFIWLTGLILIALVIFACFIKHAITPGDCVFLSILVVIVVVAHWRSQKNVGSKNKSFLFVAGAFIFLVCASSFIFGQDARLCNDRRPPLTLGIAACTRVIEGKEDMPQGVINALNHRGLDYIIDHQFDLALADYYHAMELDPTNFKTLVIGGAVKQAMRNYDGALNAYALALQLAKNNQKLRAIMFAVIANLYLDEGKLVDAQTELDEGFAIDPESGHLWAEKAFLSLNRGDFKDAVSALDAAIAVNSDAFFYVIGRGIAKIYSGSAPDAVEDFVKAMPLARSYNDKMTAVLLLHIAHQKAGQDDKVEFDHNSGQSFPDQWPKPILDLYRGRANVDEVLAKSKIGEQSNLIPQACDVDFYLGEFDLQSGQTLEASSLFKAADKDCNLSDPGHAAAAAELKNLATSEMTKKIK